MSTAEYFDYIKAWLKDGNYALRQREHLLQGLVAVNARPEVQVRINGVVLDETPILPVPATDLSYCFVCGEPVRTMPPTFGCQACRGVAFCSPRCFVLGGGDHSCCGVRVSHRRMTTLANYRTPPTCRACGKQGTLDAPLKHCPCMTVTYCSVSCQKADRKAHTPTCCKAVPKASG